jgi:hypothetical protein
MDFDKCIPFGLSKIADGLYPFSNLFLYNNASIPFFCKNCINSALALVFIGSYLIISDPPGIVVHSDNGVSNAKSSSNLRKKLTSSLPAIYFLRKSCQIMDFTLLSPLSHIFSTFPQ